MLLDEKLESSWDSNVPFDTAMKKLAENVIPGTLIALFTNEKDVEECLSPEWKIVSTPGATLPAGAAFVTPLLHIPQR